MKPYWKKKFLTALRSGKYKRGRHLLRNKGDHYCPLGILCDVVNPQNWWAPEHGDTSYYMWGDFNYALPPQSLLRKVGITEDAAWGLAVKNDQKRMGLAKAADYVEANW